MIYYVYNIGTLPKYCFSAVAASFLRFRQNKKIVPSFAKFQTTFTSVIFWSDDFFYLVIFCALKKKRFLAVKSSFLRFRQNKKKSSPKLRYFGQLLLKPFFDLMTFFASFFCSLQKKRFLAVESSFLRFRQNKKNRHLNG